MKTHTEDHMDDQQETIELRIIGYRKTKEGDVISFAIQNDDRQKGLRDLDIGTRLHGVFAAIKD